MKKQEKRCERIARYEKMYDEAAAAVLQANRALEELQAVQGTIEALDAYYTSPQWKEDFAADEAGLLPQELKRGVLSEDGLYDLLEDYRRLTELL